MIIRPLGYQNRCESIIRHTPKEWRHWGTLMLFMCRSSESEESGQQGWGVVDHNLYFTLENWGACCPFTPGVATILTQYDYTDGLLLKLNSHYHKSSFSSARRCGFAIKGRYPQTPETRVNQIHTPCAIPLPALPTSWTCPLLNNEETDLCSLRG